MKKSVKIAIISAVALAAVVGALFAARYYVNSSKSVGVIQVSDIANTWGNSSTSGYGQISSGGTETIRIENGKLIDKIYVKEGDRVKKGDSLFKYDETQARLEVESYNLQYQMAKNNLDKAQRRLEYLQSVHQYSGIETTDEITVSTIPVKGSGTEEDPYVFNINPYTIIDKDFISAMSGFYRFDIYYQGYGSKDVIIDRISASTADCSYPTDLDLSEILHLDINMNNYLTFDDPNVLLPKFGTHSPAHLPLDLDEYQLDYEQTLSEKELKALVDEQEKEIKELKLALAQAELDYRKVKNSMDDGIVKATSDGVITFINESRNISSEDDFMTIKSSLGYEVTTTITEYQLDDIHVGDTFEIRMWSNGMTYTATIKKISSYPTANSYSYSYGSSASNYEIVADLDCEDELQAWDGGETTFTGNGSEALFSLETMFVREENGQSYCLVDNGSGRLEKRILEVGKVVDYGYYVEILDGLSLDDYIAFPYGDGKVGAKIDYDAEVYSW